LRYYLERLPKDRVDRAHVDGDHWKTWVHKRLSVSMDEPGALTLFRATEAEHRSFAHHLAAERQFEELKGGRLFVRWDMKSRINHWLDALYEAAAAGHYAGWRLVDAGGHVGRRPAKAIASRAVGVGIGVDTGPASAAAAAPDSGGQGGGGYARRRDNEGGGGGARGRGGWRIGR
jgi:hypothetical protein